jgi:hypothetical protein
VDIMRAHVHEAPIPLNQRVQGKRFSLELEGVLGKALAKRREDRYETAIALAQALRRCLTNPLASTAARRALPSDPAPVKSVSARAPAGDTEVDAPGSEADPPELPVQRGPLIAIGAGVALLLLLFGVLLGRWLH